MSQDRDDGTLAFDAGGASIAADPAEGVVALRQGRLARILSLDEALLLAFRRIHRPGLTRVARALTAIGDGRCWTAAGLVLLASGNAAGVHLGLRLAAATLLATALSQPLKRGLARARPDSSIAGFEALAANPDRFSFPSGHSAAAVAVAVAFAGEPLGAGPASLLLAAGIALSRVYLGAHYPLDVGAGVILGVLAGLASRMLVG